MELHLLLSSQFNDAFTVSVARSRLLFILADAKIAKGQRMQSTRAQKEGSQEACPKKPATKMTPKKAVKKPVAKKPVVENMEQEEIEDLIRGMFKGIIYVHLSYYYHQ